MTTINLVKSESNGRISYCYPSVELLFLSIIYHANEQTDFRDCRLTGPEG